MSEAYTIGVIGGADGPTAVFVTGRFPWEIFVLSAICVGAVILYIRRKTKEILYSIILQRYKLFTNYLELKHIILEKY